MSYCSQMAIFYCCGELKPIQSLWRGIQLLGEIKSMSRHFHPPLIVCPINHGSFEETILRVLEKLFLQFCKDSEKKIGGCDSMS